MARMTQFDLETSWTSTGIDGVNHKYDDVANPMTGEFSGVESVIIALLSIEPEPVFVLEFRSGRSAVVNQSDLISANRNTGRRLTLNQL